jgi:hypothetical protein
LNGSSWLDIGRIVSLFTPQKIGQNRNNTKLPVMVLDFPMKTLMQDLLAVDWKSFQERDKTQPMKIIASGLFSEESVVLGSEEGSFDDLESLCECVKASCMLPGVAGVDPFWRRAAPSRSPWKRAQGRARLLERLSRNTTSLPHQPRPLLPPNSALDNVRGALESLDSVRTFCTKTLTSARTLALHKLSSLGQDGSAQRPAPGPGQASQEPAASAPARADPHHTPGYASWRGARRRGA